MRISGSGQIIMEEFLPQKPSLHILDVHVLVDRQMVLKIKHYMYFT